MRYGPGRPPLDWTTPTVMVHACITASQKQYLRRLAAAQRTTVAAVVRETIDQAIRLRRDDDDDADDR